MKVIIYLFVSVLFVASTLHAQPSKNKRNSKSIQQPKQSKPLPPTPGDNPELQRWFEEQSEWRDRRTDQEERRSRLIRQDWREETKRADARQQKRLEEQRRLERERKKREEELEKWRKERTRRERLREEELRRQRKY